MYTSAAITFPSEYSSYKIEPNHMRATFSQTRIFKNNTSDLKKIVLTY